MDTANWHKFLVDIFYCSKLINHYLLSWVKCRKCRDSYPSTLTNVLYRITTQFLKRNTMKIKIYFWIIGLSFISTIESCESFVEMDSPNFQMTTEDVYNKEKTTIAAVRGIYNQLYIANFSSYGVSLLGAVSGDLLIARAESNLLQFDQHDLFSINTPDASLNQNIWSSAYNIIYLANKALEGLKTADISNDLRKELRGQVLFIRAFSYFYLTNIYGDVPLLL